MPIRMTEDDPQGNKRRRTSRPNANQGPMSGRGSGNLGGGLGNIVGALLPMLLRKPKLLLVLVAVGVVVYFFFGRSCTEAISQEGGISNFVRGGELNSEIYEQTEIYEPLADNVRNPLPERFSLEKYIPTRLNQGQQGSCVAWASAYAARTILEAQRTGKNPNSVRFSPSFMYNQISIDHTNCQGSYIKLAMDNMMNIGAVPFDDFKYDQSDCNRKPGNDLKAQAQAYKIKGFQRLTSEGQSRMTEMLAIKQNLSKGSPVIIGMMVGGSFMQNMMGKEVWIPTRADYSKSGFGGHAMCIIGYDDYKIDGEGAFQIMNSWGEDWGKKGIFWIRYSDFKEFNVESYGLYPMGNASQKEQSVFKGDFGLELNAGKKTIALKKVGDLYFESVGKLKKGDRFKVELTNNVECYTYIFGEEKDGTSYVLFPYTAKHSPYCGITGTRLFPRDTSMEPDDIGTKDKIAVLITKKPIDYNAVSKKITSAQGANYETKVKNALGSMLTNNVQFSGSNTISFSTSAKSSDAVAFVIGINK